MTVAPEGLQDGPGFCGEAGDRFRFSLETSKVGWDITCERFGDNPGGGFADSRQLPEAAG
jgi:hypothetical protein